MQTEFIVYEDVVKKNPVKAFSFKESLPECYIEEIYRIAETDPRFNINKDSPTAYSKLAEYLRTFWKVEIVPRRLQYIHLVLRRHNEVLYKLSRGGKMPGNYRSIVLRGAESKNIRKKDKVI